MLPVGCGVSASFCCLSAASGDPRNKTLKAGNSVKHKGTDTQDPRAPSWDTLPHSSPLPFIQLGTKSPPRGKNALLLTHQTFINGKWIKSTVSGLPNPLSRR